MKATPARQSVSPSVFPVKQAEAMNVATPRRKRVI
jgi:hypothetical protein